MKFIYNRLFSALLLLVTLVPATAFSQKLETVFGPIEIDSPAVSALLEHKIMKRLKGIDQSGLPHYFATHVPNFTRYDHSVGVFALLHKINAPVEEQIAGLLHDASHTVFSHTGDWVVGAAEKKDAYQDEIHSWYLKEMKIDILLDAHGIKFDEILHKGNNHYALEQDLPDMCADRIEYNLHTALNYSLMTRAQVNKIISDLRFENNKWYFTDAKSAREFANLSLYFTRYLWGSAWNQAINYWSGQMLKRALEINLITKDDFHFGSDREVLQRLENSNDSAIREYWEKCRAHQNYYEVVTDGKFDFETHPKFRGIDPYVMVNGKLRRLTSIDPDFQREYEKTREYTKNGLKIKILK